MKTLKIDDNLHRDLKIEASEVGTSIGGLAHIFLRKAVPERKARKFGNGKPTKKREIVYG